MHSCEHNNRVKRTKSRKDIENTKKIWRLSGWKCIQNSKYAWSLSQFETPWKLFLCNTRQEIVFFSELGKSCWSQNICLHENIAFSTKITMGNKLRKKPGTFIFDYLLPTNQSNEWGDKTTFFCWEINIAILFSWVVVKWCFLQKQDTGLCSIVVKFTTWH